MLDSGDIGARSIADRRAQIRRADRIETRRDRDAGLEIAADELDADASASGPDRDGRGLSGMNSDPLDGDRPFDRVLDLISHQVISGPCQGELRASEASPRAPCRPEPP